MREWIIRSASLAPYKRLEGEGKPIVSQIGVEIGLTP